MELPSDLVEEILIRLPARSLERLRYTCKQWKTLITDPRFVNKHLPYMRCREQQFTVLNRGSRSPECSTISCVGIDSNKPACLKIEFVKPLDSWVNYMSHCDGLLLLVMRTKLLVMNPLLKEGRWIKCGGYGIAHYRETAYGLGYISSNQSSSRIFNDYKMVRFRCYRPYDRLIQDVKVEVYEFECDRWKPIVAKTFDGFYGLPLSSVCLRGTPYWLGYNKYDKQTISIQSFDFSKERFEYLFKFLDESFGSINSWEDSLSLGVFKGDHLALLHGSFVTARIHIWVMKLNKDWSKLMTVNNLIPKVTMNPERSSYFIENNGKLILSIRHYKFASCIYVVGENQECQLVEDFPIDIESSIGGCYYVPSLLQVPAFQGEKKKKKMKKKNTELPLLFFL